MAFLESADDFYISDAFDEYDDNQEPADDFYISDVYDENEENQIFPISDVYDDEPADDFYISDIYDDEVADDFDISDVFDENEDNEIFQISDVPDDELVDDLYISGLSDENEEIQIFPVSDTKYAEEQQFQNSLMVSSITVQMSNKAVPLTTQESPASKPEVVVAMEFAKEVGESSQSFCEICIEKKESDDMFRNQTCHHSFCCDCISKHVAAKIQENKRVVMCPGLDCQGVLELNACRPIIGRDVLERWDEMLCESMILASEKFYCPFRDCSAMLVNDSVGEVIRESECPVCRRLFCAQCNVPWHSGIECEESQRLNEDERGREDLMVRELAKEKNWMRCPHCKYYVEKTEGCLHMTCRCGFQFCYACGATWTSTHGGCQPP